MTMRPPLRDGRWFWEATGFGRWSRVREPHAMMESDFIGPRERAEPARRHVGCAAPLASHLAPPPPPLSPAGGCPRWLSWDRGEVICRALGLDQSRLYRA
jgi:hypothetical protein